MFYLYQSNRLERLFDELANIIARPLSDPLIPEEIVVQNPGTARWLSRQIALRTGIAANLEFPLPARFIWRIFTSQLDIPEEGENFNRQAIRWRIFELLGTSVHRPEFTAIKRYLADDRDGRKVFQLAGRIADLFDQYLVYRPDLLTAWEAGEDKDWQAALWREVAPPGSLHRAGLLQNFREHCRRGLPGRSALPERIIVFGVSSLAPAYLEVIHRISTAAEVHFFHLSPCRSYWFDLVSGKDIAKKRSLWRRKNLPDVSEYYETGNSLLASLGSVGQEFSLQLGELDVLEKELYEAPAGDFLLAALQRDILDLTDPEPQPVLAAPGRKQDNSVQFHICHSRTREVQVLHNSLLQLFEQDHGMKPGHILVMAPDIEVYDSAVRAVFEGVEQERYIPWSLADRSVRSEQPLVEAFLALFELLSGRFEAPEVIAFLENDAVLRRFAIGGAQISKIRDWVRESGIRWGRDAAHRQEYGCSMSDLHSWRFGLHRMLLGYISGSQAEMFAGIAPYSSLSADESVQLGKFAAFFDCLQTFSLRLPPDKSVQEWAMLLHDMLDDFFVPGNNEGDLKALLGLRETIEEWRRNCRAAGVAGKISLPVIKNYFTEMLSAKAGGQPFQSGRVTFCNMVPMRSLPFGVIWLLGMNDTDYPRNRRPAAFDLISRQPRLGDRNRRNDDCYLFLEALISARRVFGVSWVGRDQQDNSIRSPSVVVSSLLDYGRKLGRTEWGDGFELPVTEHPLQPFSTRCFNGSTATASYAAEWLPAQAAAEPQPFLPGPLPLPDEEWYELDLQQLVRYWLHPVQFFLRERLRLDPGEKENLLSGKEPFQADGLERYFLTREITDDIINGRNLDDRYSRLQASGRLPHGSFGREIFDGIRGAAEEFVSMLAPFTDEPREDLEIELTIDRFHLTGWLDGLNSKGLVRYRAASLKCRDLLRLWIEHLAYNLAIPDGYPGRSFHVAADNVICLQPVDDPLSELRKLLELYGQGLQAPLCFYPRTSEACYLALHKGKKFDPRTTWNSGFRSCGEGEDAAYRIAFKGADPFARPFAECAVDIYAPIYRYLEAGDAGV
ncbi:MAG: exodeoxyribonuclease V subunit gamma [Desulfobulbaceae bacterium]|nr:exodeoxyribonuclease V subunit gamma [Desulfobulbaceae bacterium]